MEKTKKNTFKIIIDIVLWLTGVLVSLAVGFGMISKTLTIPLIQPIVPLAGIIVVILTIISIILTIIDRLS